MGFFEPVFFCTRAAFCGIKLRMDFRLMRQTALMRFLSIVCFIVSSALLGAAEKNLPGSGTKPPGVVINHVPASTKSYIGSPSITVLENGNYIVSHDLFGPGSSKDQTLVFQSDNKGKSWKKLTQIDGQWWSTLFTHGTNLYLIGTTREYGFAAIRRSSDGGKTWTTPKDKDSGLLLSDGKYHCAPVPVVVHGARIWRAMEDAMGPGGWGSQFRAFMMSAPVDADLLKAEAWTFSNRIERDTNWLGGKFAGWLEGNAVVLRDGSVVDMLRVAAPEYPEHAAVVQISADGTKGTFDPQKGFISFPGGAKKFTIRFDEKSGRYWSLANYVPEDFRSGLPDKTRNTLALISSADAMDWRVDKVLVQNAETKKHGYQYVDWLFDGDDLISVIRTAHDDEFGGANNYHNSNYITFYRVKNFRKLAAKR